MNAILELKNRRADLWKEAKKFLKTHRLEDGSLFDKDREIYEKMEEDVKKLGKEIERLEEQTRTDYCIDSGKDSWEAKYLIDKENWDKMEKNLLNEIDYLRDLLKQKEVKIETLTDVIKMLCK